MVSQFLETNNYQFREQIIFHELYDSDRKKYFSETDKFQEILNLLI